MDSFLHFIKRVRGGLSEAFSLEHSALTHHFSRREVTPAICYDDCNGALKIAQSMGRENDLCVKDSSLNRTYSLCLNCIVDNSDMSRDSAQEFLEPQFGQFIDYCNNYGASASSTNIETSIVLVTAVRSTRPSCKVCSTMTITGYDGQLVRATIDLEAITTSFGDISLSAPTSTPTDTPEPPSSSQGPNLATIIGPVVPSLFLLCVLGFLAFRWYKRRQASKTQEGPVPNEEEPKQDKPQLHSDCIARPTFELEGSMPPATDVGSGIVKKSEMAANEPAAHEMSTDKGISRKPVGKSA
ncbi:hypothetical protein ACHAQI_011881 [Fusarium lateritium]